MIKPNKIDYGYNPADGPEDEPGWAIEGGEEAFALASLAFKLWEKWSERLFVKASEALVVASATAMKAGSPTKADAASIGANIAIRYLVDHGHIKLVRHLGEDYFALLIPESEVRRLMRKTPIAYCGEYLIEGSVITLDASDIGGEETSGVVMFNTDSTLDRYAWGMATPTGWYKTDFMGKIEVVGISIAYN